MSSKPIKHWIVPFAASLSEPCQHALPRLAAGNALPNLRRVLSQLQEVQRIEGDEYALSTPHERVLARAMGWPDSDGLMPWASWWAAQDGLVLEAGKTWGMLSPGHWLMGRDHLTLLDPATLGLSEAESRTVFDAIRPLFEEDGWTLRWGSAQRWYAAHPSLSGLPTASLDRVIGRNPDLWLTDHSQARMVRRLQSEVQMLLYQHPVNDAREAQGLATVNSFWLSGCGAVPACTDLPPHIALVNDLRAPMLADDMPSWLVAWAQVDATILKAACQALDAGQAIELTLCGERHAMTLAPAPATGLSARLWQSLKRLTSSGSGSDPVPLLNSL
ncbi:MAG: hypothetical protein HY836_02310 [Aquabacterium sp.]|nr:hypothetical protein [Aquabacterium sp.]